ncbi:MAG: RNA polymerase factor sigma-54 [Sphingomonadaceae bacterium]|nr:RNA polymerase factor sigma-54 [Sphingomonadaceae bacterium]
MSTSPRLELRQSQSLVMTPQLQQAIKLLALSNLEIETYIGETLEANPLLEIGQEAPDLTERAATSEADQTDDHRRTSLENSPVDQLVLEGRGAEDRPVEAAPDPGSQDRDTGDGDNAIRPAAADWGSELRSASGSEAPPIESHGQAGDTLAEHLSSQVGTATNDDRLAAIARYLIGLLDEAGYLRMAAQETANEIGVSLDEIAQAITLVQTLDPTGVGATSLSECIALQAREADRYDPAMARLIDNLDLVARGEFARLRRICDVDEEDLRDMLGELRGYDPKPGLKFGEEPVSAVVPDVLLTAGKDGGWDINLNQETLPRLVVNRPYYAELRGTCDNKQSRSWLSEKLADANWLVKALDQRQRTILKVASEIVRHQDGFFRHGVSHLKPLTLRTVAEAIDMHESTVSRVTSNKYLQCERGTFELKYFFTSGISAAGGDSTASAETVKAAIKQLIDAEDPKAVLSDDTLVELLKEKGFSLARRTVAKYREAIGLGSSVQRRRQKALANV